MVAGGVAAVVDVVEVEAVVGVVVELVFVFVGEVVVEVVVEVGVNKPLILGSNNKEVQMTRIIEVSEETYDRIKAQLREKGNLLQFLVQAGGTSTEEPSREIASLQDMVGKKFYFRTVTYHLTGRVTRVIGSLLELENAAWIADSGRFSNAIKEGTLSEVEPVGCAYVNMDTVTDFFPWTHALPNKQK